MKLIEMRVKTMFSNLLKNFLIYNVYHEEFITIKHLFVHFITVEEQEEEKPSLLTSAGKFHLLVFIVRLLPYLPCFSHFT